MRDHQTILRLPDLSQMQVKVRIHETRVGDLKPGMQVRLNIQGRQYHGQVASIANQPEPTDFFRGNVKEYGAIVKINGQPKGLRPGMTAKAEILVANWTDVLSVPVTAVVEQRNQYHCWVLTPEGQIQRRTLLLGQSNDKNVIVRDGVAEGDRVIGNPRAAVAEARADTTQEETDDRKTRFGDVPRDSPARPTNDGARDSPGEQSPTAEQSR